MGMMMCACYIAGLGALAHRFGEALPRENIDPGSFPYRSFGFESQGKIYEKIGIRLWKDKLPDMSRVCPDMVPKRIYSRSDISAMRAVLKETCVAEKIHIILILLGCGCMAFWKGTGGKIAAALNALFNLPFIIIQRYNRPRLEATIARLEAKGSAKE